MTETELGAGTAEVTETELGAGTAEVTETELGAGTAEIMADAAPSSNASPAHVLGLQLQTSADSATANLNVRGGKRTRAETHTHVSGRELSGVSHRSFVGAIDGGHPSPVAFRARACQVHDGAVTRAGFDHSGTRSRTTVTHEDEPVAASLKGSPKPGEDGEELKTESQHLSTATGVGCP
eukprot:3091269-Prymnesium_polylepis.1